jgi:hypothetical protein
LLQGYHKGVIRVLAARVLLPLPMSRRLLSACFRSTLSNHFHCASPSNAPLEVLCRCYGGVMVGVMWVLWRCNGGKSCVMVLNGLGSMVRGA